MQVAAAGTGVRLSDGSTNVLPVGRHGGGAARRGTCTPGWSGGRWSAASTRAGTCTRRSCRPGTPPPTRSSGRLARGRGRPARGATSTGVGAACSTSRRPPGRWPAFLLRGLDCGALDADEVAVRPVRCWRRCGDSSCARGGWCCPTASGRPPSSSATGRIAAIDRIRHRPRARTWARPGSAQARARPGSELGSDLGDLALLPGLVDTHVHVNEPGRTEWEGFATATRAAAAGGVTTIIDMPLNSIPPTVDVDALEVKRRCAAGRCHVDVGFWGGAVPGNRRALPALHEAGVFGFKCFLIDSGVPEFPPLDPTGLDGGAGDRRRAVRRARRGPGAGRPTPAVAAVRGLRRLAAAGGRGRARSRRSSPPPPTGPARGAHPAPVRGRGPAAAGRGPGATGVRVTAETCPHYLTLAAEEVPDGATEFKCCPPIRDVGQPGRAVAGRSPTGSIDCVVSDHSPCTPELKRPRRLRRGLGRHRLASSSDCRVVWTAGRRARAHAGRRGALDGAPAGRPGRAAAQGPHRGGRRRRPGRVRPRRDLARSTRRGCTTATR